MTGGPQPGLYGCPLCDEPPPHGHDLGVILNARYYCPHGGRHEWAPRKWWQRRSRCSNCGRLRDPQSQIGTGGEAA